MHYFILGPSGAGKSFVAEEFARAKGYVWLEADVWQKDGIDELGLRLEWDALLQAMDSGPILDEFDSQANEAQKQGVVISLPGFPILNVKHQIAMRERAAIRYIVGTPGQCLDSFLERERKTGRNLDCCHWCRNTCGFFKQAENEDIAPLCVRNFEGNGGYREIGVVLNEIQLRL